MSRIQWCECQTIAQEDVGKNTWTCTAHLAEGRAFQCRRSPIDVYIDEDGWYRVDGCPDFGPPGYNCGNKVQRHDKLPRYIEVRTYLHETMDNMHKLGIKHGLNAKALNNFHHALTEVEVILKVNQETGEYTIVKMHETK